MKQIELFHGMALTSALVTSLLAMKQIFIARKLIKENADRVKALQEKLELEHEDC